MGKVSQPSRPSRRHYSHGHRWISSFAAVGQLTRPGCLTALRSRSERPRTYDFHQTSPRGLTRATPLARTWCSRSTPLSHWCRVPSIRASRRTLTSWLSAMPCAPKPRALRSFVAIPLQLNSTVRLPPNKGLPEKARLEHSHNSGHTVSDPPHQPPTAPLRPLRRPAVSI